MNSRIIQQLIPKALNISASLGCSIFIGQKYGASELALYVYAISFLNIFAVVSLLGFEVSMTEGIQKKKITRVELIFGSTCTITSSLAASIALVAIDYTLELNIITLPLAATLVFVTAAYFLSNLPKFWNISAYELIRGGGLNTIFLILLITSHYALPGDFYFNEILIISGIALLALSFYFAIKNLTKIKDNNSWGIKNYFSKSLRLGLSAIFSSIIVTGEMIIAQPFMSNTALGDLAIITRLSFALSVIFIILNNNHAVHLATKQTNSSGFTNLVKSNTAVAIAALILGSLFFEQYFSIFVDDFQASKYRLVIYLLLLAHFVNIISAGSLPFIALERPKMLSIISILGIIFLGICITVSTFFIGKGLTPFCVAFYVSLLTYKLILILYSLKIDRSGFKANDNF